MAFRRKVKEENMEQQVEQLKEYMDASNYTVAITGSGISYGYGMRRLKDTVGRNNIPSKMTPDYIKKHPDEVYNMLKDSFFEVTFDIGPSPVHKQLVELEKKGLLQGIVTQNLDCLHTVAGSTNVVPFMGEFADTVCIDCGATGHDVTVWNEGHMPTCPECGGYIIPQFFAGMSRGMGGGRRDEQHYMEQAQDMIAKADLLIIIGTTGFMSEQYLAKLRPETKLVQINPSKTAFDSGMDLNIHMDAEKVFDEILAEE